MTETCYEDRTDSVEEKLRLLRQAQREGNYDFALSLAESIKDTLKFASQTQVEKGEQTLDARTFGQVKDLPAAWAKWARGWRFYKVIGLGETSALERSGEPLDVRVDFAADQTADLRREIRVARLDAAGTLHETPSQVYGEVRQDDRRSAHLIFLADVSARGRTHYLVFYGNPDAELPDYATDLQVSGEGYELDIANNHFTAHLSRQMGQLERLTYRRGHGQVPYGAPLELVTGGEGHGESPNIDWGPDYYASNNFQKFRVTLWSQCPNYEVVRGPLCVQVRRWGFPHSPVHPLFTPSRLHMSLTYTFYAGRPYFLKEIRMDAVKGFETLVIRDDEWLFWGMPFTDGMWLDRDGTLHEGEVPEARQDDLWGVGFFNRHSRDAFVALRLEHAAEGIGPIRHNGGPTLNYYGRGQIWCRTPLLGVTRFKTGSALRTKSAYLATPYPEEEGAQIVEGARRRLVDPLVPRAGKLPRRIKARASGSLARPGEAKLASRGGPTIALKHKIWDALRQVKDDQLMNADGNVVDLGYIYDVRVSGDVVYILMTMPHRGRPRYNFIANPIRDRLLQLDGVRECVVESTWEPAWTLARLTDAGRKAMGLGSGTP
jgi:metal-sulfur cluster biosynthetic enzyme